MGEGRVVGREGGREGEKEGEREGGREGRRARARVRVCVRGMVFKVNIAQETAIQINTFQIASDKEVIGL